MNEKRILNSSGEVLINVGRDGKSIEGYECRSR